MFVVVVGNADTISVFEVALLCDVMVDAGSVGGHLFSWSVYWWSLFLVQAKIAVVYIEIRKLYWDSLDLADEVLINCELTNLWAYYSTFVMYSTYCEYHSLNSTREA